MLNVGNMGQAHFCRTNNYQTKYPGFKGTLFTKTLMQPGKAQQDKELLEHVFGFLRQGASLIQGKSAAAIHFPKGNEKAEKDAAKLMEESGKLLGWDKEMCSKQFGKLTKKVTGAE